MDVWAHINGMQISIRKRLNTAKSSVLHDQEIMISPSVVMLSP